MKRRSQGKSGATRSVNLLAPPKKPRIQEYSQAVSTVVSHLLPSVVT